MKLFRRKQYTVPCKNGVTAVIAVKSDPKKEAQWQDFLNFAAAHSTPCLHSLQELEQYLTDRYYAVPCTLSDTQRESLKVNVILNHYPSLLTFPPPLPKNPTKKQILAHAQNDTTLEQARAISAESLGLRFKAYSVPNTNGADAIVQIEETTQFLTVDNANEAFWNDVTLYLGVSEDDINNRTPRFMAYAHALRDTGKL